MRIEQKVTIDAPRHLVWEYVTEPANYPVFMEGLTRWDIAGDRHTGPRRPLPVLFRVGAADVGGLIEIVEWQPESDMAWSSVTGVDQRGRWRLRDARRRAHPGHLPLRLRRRRRRHHRPDRRAGRGAAR